MNNYIKCKWIKHTNQGQILAEWIKNKIKVHTFYVRHILDLKTHVESKRIEGLIRQIFVMLILQILISEKTFL